MSGFSSNPLSLSVPDEHFRAWATSDAAADVSGGAPKHESSTRRTPFRRVCAPAARTPAASCRLGSARGRSLAQMSVDDLLKKARPWKEFFGGSKPMEEFRLPQSQAEAVYKLSENVYEFIGNYLVIGVVCVVCVLYKRPIALVGIVVTSKAYEWLQEQSLGQGQGAAMSSTPFGRMSSSSAGSAGSRGGGAADAVPGAPPPTRKQQFAQIMVTAFTWVVLMLSNVVPAMFLAGGAAMCAVIIHALLRKPLPPSRGRR